MKYSRSPSLYRKVIWRDSVLTFSGFSPARNVFSTTAPLSMLRRRVLTKAPPLPGFTCWKYRIVNRFPSTRMAEPFLNWLVDIMLESSPSRRPIFATILRGVNPAQTPGYYRTVSPPVSHVRSRENTLIDRGQVCVCSAVLARAATRQSGLWHATVRQGSQDHRGFRLRHHERPPYLNLRIPLPVRPRRTCSRACPEAHPWPRRRRGGASTGGLLLPRGRARSASPAPRLGP